MDGIVQIIRRVGDVVARKSRVAAEFATPARQAARVAAELMREIRHGAEADNIELTVTAMFTSTMKWCSPSSREMGHSVRNVMRFCDGHAH